MCQPAVPSSNPGFVNSNRCPASVPGGATVRVGGTGPAASRQTTDAADATRSRRPGKTGMERRLGPVESEREAVVRTRKGTVFTGRTCSICRMGWFRTDRRHEKTSRDVSRQSARAHGGQSCTQARNRDRSGFLYSIPTSPLMYWRRPNNSWSGLRAWLSIPLKSSMPSNPCWAIHSAISSSMVCMWSNPFK